MPEAGEVKKWCLRVSGTVGGAIILLALAAQWGHYARSGETEARALENEKSLVPIKELVEQLGKRAATDDAAREERARLCRMGLIRDELVCGEVGEAVVE